MWVSFLLHNTLNFWALFSLMIYSFLARNIILSTWIPNQCISLLHDLDGRNQIRIQKFLDHHRNKLGSQFQDTPVKIIVELILLITSIFILFYNAANTVLGAFHKLHI